jgi:uncharacterized protein
MKVINFTSLKFRAYLLATMVLLAFTSVVFSQAGTSEVPANTGFINDYANVIDANTKSALEKRLKDLRDGTPARIEIAVLTVKTTGGKDIFDYSLAIARDWKIGSKEQDNPSVLLVVAIDDRKYFTQVSRDAEGDIPDGLAGQIQRQYLVPAFKQGQYAKGINDTVEAYIRRLGQVRGFDPVTLQKTDGTTTAPPVAGKTNKGSSLFGCVICGGIIAFIIFIFVISAVSRGGKNRRSSWNGGGFGGSGKRKGGSDGDSVMPWIIGGVIGSLLSGGGSGGSSGGGSDWGDSSGGGGGDWGGFGGGGDFGGGGAGGDW